MHAAFLRHARQHFACLDRAPLLDPRAELPSNDGQTSHVEDRAQQLSGAGLEVVRVATRWHDVLELAANACIGTAAEPREQVAEHGFLVGGWRPRLRSAASSTPASLVPHKPLPHALDVHDNRQLELLIEDRCQTAPCLFAIARRDLAVHDGLI
jgi:hypothetical protein